MKVLGHFCIVGLGNPGKNYESTRHNAGFLLLDYLSKVYGGSGSTQARYWLSRVTIADTSVFLLKPLEYMNLSGRAFREVVQYYKIPLENTLICYDDIAFSVGDFRLKSQGSAGGHNGLASILQTMNTQNIARLRLGIASSSETESNNLANFVLSSFTRQERDTLQEVFVKVQGILEVFVTDGVDRAMNIANRRPS